MPEVRLFEQHEIEAGSQHQTDALALAQRLPGLVMAAREIASSVMHGVHGRRRPGTGETFWQFRPFIGGETANRIDWRRSARDERLYVREREWEAAHTIWVWIDRSASMRFMSNLGMQSKADRALVLGLAVADLLVRGGERVGLLGLTAPLAARDIVERFADALIVQERAPSFVPTELPKTWSLARGAQALLIGDFFSDADEIAAMIDEASTCGGRGHILMIADPIEEIFPFSGHTELIDVDSGTTLRLGQAQDFRNEYIRRLGTHREKIKAAAWSRGWTFMLHRTDRPASEALLALRVALETTFELGLRGSAV